MSSNMIKAYSISYDTEKLKKLDFSEREEKLAEHVHELVRAGRFVPKGSGSGEAGFVPGIIAETIEEPTAEPATAMSEQEIEAMRESIRAELSEEMKRAGQELYDGIEAQARAEAEKILSDARAEAEMAKAGILKLASAQGYEEGLNRAKQEQEQRTRQLEQEKLRMEEEYERRVSELEPAFVQILADLVRKLTGVAYDGHAEVLRHLIDEGLRQAKKDTEFTVFLCPADLERISGQIPEIKEQYQEKLQLEFQADETLSFGDCRLENSGKRIDCGLGLQMQGLLDALEMLGGTT